MSRNACMCVCTRRYNAGTRCWQIVCMVFTGGEAERSRLLSSFRGVALLN